MLNIFQVVAAELDIKVQVDVAALEAEEMQLLHHLHHLYLIQEQQILVAVAAQVHLISFQEIILEHKQEQVVQEL